MLSAVHLMVDMYCAVLFFGCISGGEKAWHAMVLYNACAFAGQAPIGALADRLGNGLAVAAAGCLLLGASWFFHTVPIAAAVIAGLGNGAFHAGAGYSVLMDDGERARDLGIFVSTGAVGLYCGTADALIFVKGGLIFVGIFALLAGVIGFAAFDKRLRSAGAFAELEETASYKGAAPSLSMPRGGLLALCCLTAVVILRSFIGATECFAIPSMPGSATVLCVAGGKALGGFIMDCVGPRKTSVFSLVPCAVIALFGVSLSTGAAARLIALLLFNMTMPITLFAAARLLKGAKGFAFGLLTFGLFIGCVPRFMGVDTAMLPRLSYALLIALSLALLLVGLKFEPRHRAAEGAK